MDVRGEPAAIEQQHDLAAPFQRLGYGPFETGAQAMEALVGMAVVAQVDEVDVRQRPIMDTPRQRQQGVLAALGVVPAFQGRRR